MTLALTAGHGLTPVFGALVGLLNGVPRDGVIHLGAHMGEEVPVYRAVGFDRIVLVEPQRQCWPTLARTGAVVHQCAAGPTGRQRLYVTRWPQRSSLLRPVRYRVRRTVTVDVRPVSEMQEGCNVLVADTQGSELDALRTADLDALDLVVVECSSERRYKGAAVTAEIDAHMTAAGWHKVATYGGHAAPALVDAVWRRQS